MSKRESGSHIDKEQYKPAYTDATTRAQKFKDRTTPHPPGSAEENKGKRLFAKALLFFALLSFFGIGLEIDAGRSRQIPTPETHTCPTESEIQNARCATIAELTRIEELIQQGFDGSIVMSAFAWAHGEPLYKKYTQTSGNSPESTINEIHDVIDWLNKLPDENSIEAYYGFISLEKDYLDRLTPYGRKNIQVGRNFFAVTAHIHEVSAGQQVDWDHFMINHWSEVRVRIPTPPYFPVRSFIFRAQSQGPGFSSGLHRTFPYVPSSDQFESTVAGIELSKFSQLIPYLITQEEKQMVTAWISDYLARPQVRR
jgi:hypothetical protein